MTDLTTLDDSELIVLMLRSNARVSVGRIRDLLDRFGGLRPLLQAPPAELAEAVGIGDTTSAALLALPEIARRYYRASLPVGRQISAPTDTEDFLRAELSELDHEVFCCIYLDNRHRVIQFVRLFRGTLDGTSVHPREIVKEALAVNAAAVIAAHNHPSGVAEPSQADERITARIKAALELVDIRLLDHLIIGTGAATSLASRGLL